MRIGINANFFQKPMTGIGVVTREFMQALKDIPDGREHEWIWYFEGDIPQGAWPDNWHFEAVSTWWSRDDLLHRFLWERLALPRRIQRDRCDLFLSLYQSATVLLKRVRHGMLVHDLVPKHFPEYQENLRQRLYYRAIERAYASVDYFITPSASTKHDLEQFLAIPAAQISVAPLGVSDLFRAVLVSSVRDDILNRYGLEPGYLYHGGGLERRKNTETLLRAYASLSGGVTETRLLPPLVISGKVYPETNPLATPVRSLISELGLERQVRLLGCVPDSDLPALYQGASMFIYPSRFEGFGLPVLEAFASGTPVVTTAAGSLAELTGDAAMIVAPDDVTALAKAICSLLGDESARRALGAKGRERSTQYLWSRFAQTIVSTLLQ